MGNREELAGFFARLGTLLSSEVPLLRAFSVAAERVGHWELNKALERVLDRAYQGSSLLDAFSAEAPLFSEEILCLLEAGELAGDVERKALDIARALTEGVFDVGRHPAGAGDAEDPLERLIFEAVSAGASDVHLEPVPGGARLRFRVAGSLTERGLLDQDQAAELARLARRRAGIPPDELPQDGTFMAGDLIVRASTCPYAGGEGLVLRLIPAGEEERTLEEVGLSAEEAEEVRSWLGTGNGIVIVAGPDGSGKTTTLAAMLAALDRASMKVTAIEGAPAIRVPGVNRIRVVPEEGLTHAVALSSQLAQDLDAVYLNEIPTFEAADMVIRAALTGHLVLASTTDRGAPEALAILAENGLDPEDLAVAVRGVVAQVQIPSIRGGRVPVHEVMGVTPGLRAALRADPSRENLRKTAEAEGLVPLLTSARKLVEAGDVEASEVERLLGR